VTYTTSWAEERSSPRVALFLSLTVVALAFLLRVYRIDAEGLWIDEAFSVWLARQPFGQMLRWIMRIDQIGRAHV